MNLSKSSLITALTLAFLAVAPMTRGQDSKDQKSDAKPERPAAGQRERRGPGGANSFERVAERLKLTDEQKTKLQPIYQEEISKLRDLRQDTALTAEQRRDKVRELREQYLAKMKPILTTEQFEELKKSREGGMGRGPRGPRQGGESSSNSNADKK